VVNPVRRREASPDNRFAMPAPRPPAFDTLSLHAGQRPDPTTGARATPIYETTSYVFRDSDQAAALFNLESAGHLYTRISNPTTAVLEERIAALEGGVGAVCTASGMAALHLAIATLAGAGDHIVASSSLYGGTINLLTQTLPRFGIRTTLVGPRDLKGFAAAIGAKTRLVIGETIGNPGLEVLDIPALASIAHDAGVPLMIDNTFATPYLSRPIEWGADIVMHSLTKWIGGHGLVIGGALIDAGRFDWFASGRHATMIEPCEGYHGLVFAEHFGPSAFIMRARSEGLRDFGACLSPHNAARLLTGVETLSLRMQRHIENTLRVLDALGANPAVTWVTHPSLASHADHELAARLLPRGAGSIVSFGVRGGRPAGRKFIEALRLASHLANVGDAKTLVIHPASTTHQQMSAAQLAAAGVGEDMVRLSVGLEDPADILADLDQALRASQKN
jgi:O-acetylhomoserine (thiol)-lyase